MQVQNCLKIGVKHQSILTCVWADKLNVIYNLQSLTKLKVRFFKVEKEKLLFSN